MITEQTFAEVRLSEALGAKSNTTGKGLMSVGGGPSKVEL